MTWAIKLPTCQEVDVHTHDRGFLDALNSEDVFLTGQHWIDADTTVVFMGGNASDEYLAIKMDQSVEPCDLSLLEFETLFPNESWRMFTSKI